jgi:hypothetical protein
VIKKFVFGLILTGLLHLASFASAGTVSLTGLFDTGVSSPNHVLPDGTSPDPHYALVAVPVGSTTATRVRTSAGGYPIPPYIPDDTFSAWIGPNNPNLVDLTHPYDLTGPQGLYDYQTTFFSPGAGLADITGSWATDNEGVDIKVDGASGGSNTIPLGGPPPAPYSFETFYSFSVKAAVHYGTNYLDFIVNNNGPSAPPDGDNPTALRVEFQSALVAIPLPRSAWGGLGLLGAIGIVRLMRRQNESPFA